MTDKVVAPGPAVIEQNTSGVVGVLAEALAQHRGGTNHSGDWECSCGKEGPEKSHDAHVASVVAALPNIAVVILPKPDTNDRIQHWKVGDISVSEGTGLVWADLEPTVHSHVTARVVAANLLAAARAARGQA